MSWGIPTQEKEKIPLEIISQVRDPHKIEDSQSQKDNFKYNEHGIHCDEGEDDIALEYK